MNITPALQITGWMSVSELGWLAKNAADHNIIVEAGCYYGRSTRVLCDNTSGVVHAVDPWSGNYGKNFSKDGTPLAYITEGPNMIFNKFMLNLNDHIFSKKCIMHIMEFHNTRIENPDMIFIDAIHDYEDVYRDIEHAMKLMDKGLLCGHDYSNEWPGVIQAVDEWFPKITKVFETIWFVELT